MLLRQAISIKRRRERKYCVVHMSTYTTKATVYVLFGYSTLFPLFLNSFSLNFFNSLLNYSEYILPTPFSTFDSREKELI